MDDAARAEPPLVVDLDDTLVRTDLLFEGLLTHLGQQPGDLRRLPGWLASGKAGFKRRLAERASPEIETLPLNSDVVAQIEASRAVGQRVVLVTASDQIYADQVAERLGLFDEVHGSDGQRNLGGAEKARFLEERFGRGGYDYIGDSKRDLPVWAAGRHAYPVGRAQRLSVSAGGEVKPLGGPGPRGAWLRAIRPHQWLKNALIAVPMLTAFQLEATTLAMVLVAFVCFSLTASSVYLINDLLDLADDRRHPRKSKRPFAAGDLGIRDGLFLAAGLIVSAFSLALAAMPLGFIAVLGIYYAATFAYSLALKRRSVLDVCTLAGLYSMRVIAGGVATGIHLSPWLLAFSMFIFLSLAAVKRQAEMTDLLNTDPTRKTGRPYEVEDLPVIRSIAMSAGYASVLVMALYVNSSEAISRLAVPEAIWLICPLLLYWVTRMVLVTHRGQMTDDPIVFAIRDRTSTVVVLLMVAAAALARVGW